ncbi:bifunctional phosphoribosylaminoimidazolecarboxamide formyltransferase/inosine monophosphate cyclohydrolase [Halalkalibacillus sediminis]|uniref:Bifunctional purine biosynthesis protein PurH n=1 Tax=Halalkalibacillus sediminis TaxID=2018042 RepID=A0A2I0QQE6_9BACI|nr:bifunctional phosphoribosylaminoimidazolecarboxamide formyltransferase/IMP cyclohydrolase [Halalkalibacillus sediminis]PKR76553.1 bifunctional phosphoribosylaminoimidazolecarboxamide formyltransferase/inosine monophosphate cyclohydrolase [Halalkalibacillus sediminis]
MIKRALLSVSDKNGIEELAKKLDDAGVELISTGGTKRVIEEAGVTVKGISEVTDFPEIMDGRVKTLHPNVHGALLAKRSSEDHQSQLKEHGITPIDLVVVNLYPFKETVAKEDVSFEDAIENIDIGGPTLLRSAAKNHQDVTVVVNPEDYETVVTAVQNGEEVSFEKKKELAAKVFRHTAQYDSLVADYLTDEAFPETKTVTYERKQVLRYGENPHQKAAFYVEPFAEQSSLAHAKQLHGKELSYNNIQDADAALSMVREFDSPAAVAVKHTNPCGVGTGKSLFEAYSRAYAADPVSIFGGIVALNRPVEKEVADKLSQIFLEIIIAPSFTDEAFDILSKKKNIRLLEIPVEKSRGNERLHSVTGGVLIQEEDQYPVEDVEFTVATEREPTEDEWTDLKFAWQIVKHVKSNAILLAKDQQTVGVGAGQMNRVGAAAIAIEQAGAQAQGAAMASDAFFPMDDTVEAAHQAGVRAIIQPGGSIRDEDSIKKCNEYGITMVFTGVRHFKH